MRPPSCTSRLPSPPRRARRLVLRCRSLAPCAAAWKGRFGRAATIKRTKGEIAQQRRFVSTPQWMEAPSRLHRQALGHGPDGLYLRGVLAEIVDVAIAPPVPA